MIRIYDMETDKTIDREMTNAELKIVTDSAAAYEATKAQAIAEKSASVAKLEALGLTVDDLKVLGS